MYIGFILVILVAAAYLLGSVPSAVWIGKRFYGADVRQHGSMNAGTANALRVLGPKAAAAVLAIDMEKGYFAVALSYLIPYEEAGPQQYNLKIALAVAAVAGHIFPIFARFRGGKGVATLAGAVLGVYPAVALLCLATFAAMLILTRYVSLSSMTAGVVLPVYMSLVFHETYVPLVVFCCAVAALLIFMHRKNIKRLIYGDESKISFHSRAQGRNEHED